MARILILGTGIGGLFTAIKIARQSPDAKITLVCKADPMEGATRYAQGGIASVWSKQDSFAEHIQDTLDAGAGLCNREAVEVCVTEGPSRVQELIDLGVEFTRASSPHLDQLLDLHQEGGHRKRRILHSHDLTGLEIERALLAQVRALAPRVEILEKHVAIDLIMRNSGKVLGAYVLDAQLNRVKTMHADAVVLATGGAGKVYLYTSNPDTATGDGIAMAHRVGARVANLEFIQFHPTCLYHPQARTFLITEAMRGEGAVLKNLRGEEFMKKHHEMGSLAPRDVVARAIDLEMKRTGDRHVWLDCSPIAREDIQQKFPNIFDTCFKLGIDIRESPIPVVPAAHYTCGGVWVNLEGRTSVEGLYAVGEAAYTGLHGANRLASNSLLEAVVFGERIAQNICTLLAKKQTPVKSHSSAPLPEWDPGRAVPLDEQIDIAANWLEIRTLMWNYVGIVRSNRRLERALRRIEILKAEVNAYYWNFLLTTDLIELRNLLAIAELIVQSALSRRESRGLHYTTDYPARDDLHYSKDTVL